jgi:hypothetical protein
VNPEAIPRIVSLVQSRFDRELVAIFPDTDREAHARITDRIILSLDNAIAPHPIDVYNACFATVKERDPSAIDLEEDGTEIIADVHWQRAELAAFDAAIAYTYPEMLTETEQAILARAWESVMGSP